MGFQQVKTILNAGLDAWEAQNGQADLSNHSPNFGKASWDTKAALLAAVGHNKRLIQPEMIGNGQGGATNLIVDLRTGIDSPGLRMPLGGPFIADNDIQTIQDWIDAGCPD